LGGLASSELICFERSNVFGLFGENGKWFTKPEGASLISNFGNESLISGLKSHGSLIGFDFANSIPDIDLITFLDIPLNNFTLSHGGRQGWHLR
jgi:hypothetical protein